MHVGSMLSILVVVRREVFIVGRNGQLTFLDRVGKIQAKALATESSLNFLAVKGGHGLGNCEVVGCVE